MTYISREAAIEAVKNERKYTGKYSFEEEHAWSVGFQQGITFALSDICTLPSADVREVKQGKWVMEDDGTLFYRCSACGKAMHGWFAEIYIGDGHFCPNCGADMREEQT